MPKKVNSAERAGPGMIYGQFVITFGFKKSFYMTQNVSSIQF